MKRVALILCLALCACSQSEAARDDIDLYRRADPYFNRFIESDSDLLWRPRPGRYAGKDLFGEGTDIGEVVVGSLGLRGGDPGEKTKPRVLCLGDSVTAGYERAYPEYLAELTQTETLNAGVPGYSIAQARRWFAGSSQGLNADVVVVLLAWNDAKDRLRGYDDADLMDSWWARLMARFRGVTSIDESAEPRSAASGCCRVAPARYLAELAGLVEEIRAAGAAPVLVSYPTVLETDAAAHYPKPLVRARRVRLAAIREAVLTVGAQTGVRVVDLAPHAQELLDAGYFRAPTKDPIHPSNEGARILSRRIAPSVSEALKNR